MARKRIIDPEFFLDEELAKISPHARLLYIGSWTIADDRYFTLPNRPDWIKAQIFPYENVDITKEISELVSIQKYIEFTNGDKKPYLFVPNMAKYQRIDKPSKYSKASCHPEFEVIIRKVLGEDSDTIRRILNNYSERTLSEEKRREEKGSEYIGGPKASTTSFSDECKKPILYLNKTAGTHFEPDNKQWLGTINARFREGYTLEDFFLLIDEKVRQWANDEKMKNFLRPRTLFTANHMEEYLSEAQRQNRRTEGRQPTR
jgi:uncharacterized phage protein (TIGR02220 family)